MGRGSGALEGFAGRGGKYLLHAAAPEIMAPSVMSISPQSTPPCPPSLQSDPRLSARWSESSRACNR
eukprot:745847-Hanusia_phi.AAC.1